MSARRMACLMACLGWALCQESGAFGAEGTGLGVSVRDQGAVGDGKTDDTQAFLNAVIEAKKSGASIYVPAGRYAIGQTIELDGISLTGPPGGAWPADNDVLPAILPTHVEGPTFHMKAGAGLHWIDITRESNHDQPAGPAVLISGIGVFVSNMRIRYAWDGILSDGQSNVGRLNVENVFMVSIRNIGIRVTGTWDVPRLNNVEVWNNGPVPRPLDQGIAFHLGKNDLIRMTDCFAFGYGIGFLLEDKIEGSSIEGGTWGVMNGCATDYCGKGIELRGSHTLSVDGGSFWNHRESIVLSGDEARFRISSSELKSNGAPAVVVRSCDHAVISGCSILRPMKEFDVPTVVLEAGRIVMGSNHIEGFGEGIRIGPSVRSAVVQGNRIESHGDKAIVDKHGPEAEIVIEGNAGQKE